MNSLLGIITRIVNMSISSGTFPQTLKHALVRPSLKKSNLDSENLKNYHPVSNISLLSKIIENVVVKRITEHLDRNNLNEKFQSAYRPGHSTETALVRICSDILGELDNKRGVLLVMLDLSAAFDTLDYSVLTSRMENRLGISGTALKWVDDYHRGRTQSVIIEGQMSSPIGLESGGPQGSVMGAENYKMYTLPVGDIICKHGLRYSIYADDSQKYVFVLLGQ